MCNQQSLRSACAYAQSDQSLYLSLANCMDVKLLTEYHLDFLSLKVGCTDSSESTLVKMPHCWKSHVADQMWLLINLIFFTVHTGKLKGKEGIVSVKIYNPSAGVENVSQEIAKIRYNILFMIEPFSSIIYKWVCAYNKNLNHSERFSSLIRV